MNRIRGERRLEVGDESYVLLFTNEAYVELDDMLPEGGLPQAFTGTGVRALQALLWAGTRHHHSEDFTTLEDINDLIDDLNDAGLFYPALNITIEAYKAAQPERDPDEEDIEPDPNAQPFSWKRFLKQGLRIGLKPQEFWAMTPDETSMQIEAYNDRWDDFSERMSHLLPPLHNVHVTKKHHAKNAKDFFDREKIKLELQKKREEKLTPEQLKNRRRRYIKEFKSDVKPFGASRRHDKKETKDGGR